jgi:hypothetical protein
MLIRTHAKLMTKIRSKINLCPHSHFTEQFADMFVKQPFKNDRNQEISSFWSSSLKQTNLLPATIHKQHDQKSPPKYFVETRTQGWAPGREDRTRESQISSSRGTEVLVARTAIYLQNRNRAGAETKARACCWSQRPHHRLRKQNQKWRPCYATENWG